MLKYHLYGAYGVIVAQELVELLDSERNRIGTQFMNWNDENLIKILKEGGVAVMPTDTIYGVVGSDLNKNTVDIIFKIRNRNPEKPCINLIGSIDQLQKFNISISEGQKKQIQNFTEPTSFILDTTSFRLPDNENLRNLLLQTGPLIAPSANTEGMPPAQNIFEAKKYFGRNVDIYIDGGEIKGKASRVIKLHKDGSIDILRA